MKITICFIIVIIGISMSTATFIPPVSIGDKPSTNIVIDQKQEVEAPTAVVAEDEDNDLVVNPGLPAVLPPPAPIVLPPPAPVVLPPPAPPVLPPPALAALPPAAVLAPPPVVVVSQPLGQNLGSIPGNTLRGAGSVFDLILQSLQIEYFKLAQLAYQTFLIRQ